MSCSAPLNKGQVAPYSGQLLTPVAAINVGLAAKNCDERIELEVSHTSSQAAVHLQHQKDLRAADVRQFKGERDAALRDGVFWKDEAARKVEPSSWYAHPVVVSLGTTAVLLGAFWLSLKVVDNAADGARP